MRYIFPTSTIPTLNDYIDAERSNRFIAAKMKNDATTNIMVDAMSQNRKQLNGLYDVNFYHIVPDNKKDADNIYFRQKFILDGFVKARILAGDGRKNVRHISHFIRTIKNEDFVMVRVREIGG